MTPSGPSGVRLVGRARPDELVAVGLALAERDALPERDRRRLDREIGSRAVEAGRGDGLAVLRAWLEAAPSPALRARIDRVRRALALAAWLWLGVGVFVGWSTAAALLQIEVHAGRINVVLCLGLLVVAPLLLGLIGVVAWLVSNRDVGRFDAAPASGPGGVRGWLFGRGTRALLPATLRDDLEVLLGRVAATDRRVGRARRALVFGWSQRFGLAFSSGALLATLTLVVFTDLAFGWSTTLDVDAASVHRLTRAWAAPWAWLWPEAAPSFDLVETTRHFRVASNEPHVHFIDPIRYGGWWPFLVASILVYGVLPRGLLLAWASWRTGEECGRAVALTPGVDRLLERLTTPLVESRAVEAEGEIGRAASVGVPSVGLAEWLGANGEGELLAIAWAESLTDHALIDRLGPDAGSVRVRDAGGRRSLEEDAQRIEEARAASGPVLLCVRAYEPPVLEVLDFLVALRAAIGEERRLAVWLSGGRAAERDAWLRKLATLGDPGLVGVADAPPEARP